MNSKQADQTPSPKQIFTSLPELTDEDSTDIFFSFDITALAFLWEHQQKGVNGISSLTRLDPKKKQGDIETFGVVVFQFLKDFFRTPTTYGYMLLAILVALLAFNPADLQDRVRETMTIMLAPEMDMPKPPPPPPPKEIKQEKVEKPKPVKKEVPKPKPEPPKPREVKEEPQKLKLQKQEALKKDLPKRAPVAQKRAPIKPLENTKLGKLGSDIERKAENFRLGSLATARRTDEASEGFKIRARSSADAPADLPTTFAVATSPGRKLEEKQITTSLSSIGKKERRIEEDTSKLTIDTAKRTEVEQESETLDVKIARRSENDLEESDLNLEIIQREESQETSPESLSLPETYRSYNPRHDEDFQGTWQKLENIGPVAHLNAKCFGKADGDIVRYRQFKFRCANNQIREAWKQIKK